MSWSLTQTSDGYWHWEIFQSAYGLWLGSERTFAKALIRLAIAEAELVEDLYPPELTLQHVADPERYVHTMATELVHEIGQHIFPQDEDEFRTRLTA